MPWPAMFWSETDKQALAPRPERLWSCTSLLWLLAAMPALLSATPSCAASAINVADLFISAKPPLLVVAQDGTTEGDAGREDMLFEEPSVYRRGEREKSPAAASEDCSAPPSGRELPKVAIIIDDMGYHPKIGAELLALEMNLTFSFLPHAPLSRSQGELAWRQGHDILVHMPMEAQDPSWDPGPGTLYLTDSLEDEARKVAESLASVPHAIGINNHMGSRFTEDQEAMRQFFKLLAGHDLLFIDSVTSSASVAMKTARAMGFKTARRHVFLDNVQSQEDICRQLKLLVREANGRGWAIGIGHPNEATLNALTRCRTMLQGRVQLVGVHELAR
jgi:uncharacterized protein